MEKTFEFVNPEFFWLLLLIPAATAWYLWKRKGQTASVKLSSTKGFYTGANWLAKLRPLLFLLKMVALALLVTAMARPRNVDVTTKIKKTQGIDIVMAIDVSASMLARDLKPNRLEALKEVATNFILDRVNDRFGVVVYAGESYTKTPLTTDKDILVRSVKDISYNDVLQAGTAIGSGLATAVNRLKESTAKSKVVILLTDGVNNAGFIDPKIASELAVEFGIRVYSVGIGTNGTALSPVAINRDGSFQYQNIPVEIDEQLMKEIAETTEGKYFRATSNTRLQEVYDEINKLEKTEIEELRYTSYEEKYRPFAIWAGVLLLFEILLRFTLFRSFI